MNPVQQVTNQTAVSETRKRNHTSFLDNAPQQSSDGTARKPPKIRRRKVIRLPRQRRDCHILQKLDIDAMRCVVDFLPLDTRAILSQTCRAMRNIVKVPAPRDLPHVERVNFLATMVKDRLDCWVCEGCARLHSVKPRGGRFSTTSANCTSRERKYYHLSSQHVQLALKYARRGEHTLGLDYRVCLERALRPQFIREYVADAHGRTDDVLCVVQAKIVDGRFLMRTEWSHNTAGQYKITTGDFLRMLSRQRLVCEWHNHSSYTEVDLPGEDEDPCLKCHSCLSRAAAQRAIDKVDAQGYDKFCPVDYAMRVVGGYEAQLIVWQDLGKGISPLDLAWGRKDLEGAWDPDDMETLRIGHGPGEVRKLFERK
ncbi:hypothetical protein ACHAPT_006945 [Fusarium lateritium]